VNRLLAFVALVATTAMAADPETFALVGAMGNQFSAVHENQRVGSRLPPWHTRSLEVKDDGINKLAVASLDLAVAKMHPDAKRIHLSVALPDTVQFRSRSLEEGAFETAIAALRPMPERSTWHRIVLITPANRVEAREGLGADMHGMGLFTQPLCQSDLRDCDTRRPALNGVEVETPAGKKATTSRLVAPYLFAKVWILEPNTLEVLDTQLVLDHVKLGDPDSTTLDMNQVIDRKVLVTRMVQQVETSTLEAVKRSELRGKVDVNERGVR
jgi:hypothetical protein